MFTVQTVLRLNNPIRYGLTQIYIEGICIRDQLLYSWSQNGVQWSNYCEYCVYDKICSNLDNDFFLRILVNSKLPTIFIDGIEQSYSSTIFSPTQFTSDACTDGECFDMYEGWDCAIQMQQSLSDHIICMVGIPIYYFKVEPDIESADYSFKEYVMHSVSSVKQIKMLMTDGTMPSSKPMLSEWDFQFEVDWEVELSKTQFATAFGDTAYPRSRDFIWVPMQKRMYEVNSAYEEKNEGMMWQAQTWKLALVKYNDKSNVLMDDNMENIIDELIINNYNNTLEPLEHIEQRSTGVIELNSPRYAANNLYPLASSDFLRNTISIDSINIKTKQINNKNLILAKNYYQFSNDSCVEYIEKFCGCNGSVVTIFKTPNSSDITNRIIFETGYISLCYNNGIMSFMGLEAQIEPMTTYLISLKWSQDIMTYEMNIYKYIEPRNHKINSPFVNYFDFETPIYSGSELYLDDFNIYSKKSVYLYGYPLEIYSFKLFNDYIDNVELTKYTTSNNNCVINDLVKPLNGSHGYSIK